MHCWFWKLNKQKTKFIKSIVGILSKWPRFNLKPKNGPRSNLNTNSNAIFLLYKRFLIFLFCLIFNSQWILIFDLQVLLILVSFSSTLVTLTVHSSFKVSVDCLNRFGLIILYKTVFLNVVWTQESHQFLWESILFSIFEKPKITFTKYVVIL